MTWSPPFTVLTSGDGHYLGCVYCECGPDRYHSCDFKKDCPVHGTPRRHRDPFIAALREKREVHEARGIDTEKAVNERYRTGA